MDRSVPQLGATVLANEPLQDKNVNIDLLVGGELIVTPRGAPTGTSPAFQVGMRLSPDQKAAKKKAIHETTHDQINAVLTPEQQEKFKEMKREGMEKHKDVNPQ